MSGKLQFAEQMPDKRQFIDATNGISTSFDKLKFVGQLRGNNGSQQFCR
ncbi:MAG TPA: hypothetical protein PLP07_10050 [Pyrinomonadaceae bacterium]|nr:hypothetical protein [Chloracidobacterium sp.]MBP9934872.1 hypothetical protein [Pyrinomonadaceae bacterium]MBK7803296.1 hypothetical protein [Chloracidobacterium sp.]MBK9438549.1 hypothetical protein [Chloracidobacterium sp.]MBK9766593.1 hypothetical protein [Chloracidobacterium sp.]